MKKLTIAVLFLFIAGVAHAQTDNNERDDTLRYFSNVLAQDMNGVLDDSSVDEDNVYAIRLDSFYTAELVRSSISTFSRRFSDITQKLAWRSDGTMIYPAYEVSGYPIMVAWSESSNRIALPTMDVNDN